MNALQKVEFDILKNVIHVCETLDLTYYLVCGSALGCVKYHGFIPWDDDVDVALPRRDYAIFCEKAADILPPELFVQTAETDPNFPQIYCKVRDSRTTYIEKSVSHLDIHHGVYVDVFPLDAYPQGRIKQFCFEKIKNWNLLVLSSVVGASKQTRPAVRVLFRLIDFFGLNRNTAKRIRRFNSTICAFADDGSGILCNHGNWQGTLDYSPFSQYGEGFRTTFEGLDVLIPVLYDAYLKQKYGDWRSDLPEEEQKGHHFAEKVDVSRPYTDYLEKGPDGCVQVKNT